MIYFFPFASLSDARITLLRDTRDGLPAESASSAAFSEHEEPVKAVVHCTESRIVARLVIRVALNRMRPLMLGTTVSPASPRVLATKLTSVCWAYY